MKNTIFILVGVILVCIGPMLLPATSVIRRVLDEKGQQVYRADGKPKFENDPIGQFKIDWPGYAVTSVGGIFILFGVGRAIRDSIRNRQRRYD
jgi:hypothetical protein